MAFRSKKGRSKGRNADWNCGLCGFNNFGSRAKCKNCSNGKRPANSGSTNNNRRGGDWNCASCGFNNFASRDRCKKCSKAKTKVHNNNNKSSSNTGDWNCASCAFNNFASITHCKKCSAPRGSQTAIKNNNKQLRQKVGDWKCSKCSHINFENRGTCEKCNTSKLDSNELWFKTQFICDFDEPTNAENGRKKKRKNQEPEWVCAQCNCQNRPRRKKCHKCKTPKPAATTAAYPTPMDVDDDNTKNATKIGDGVEEKMEFAKGSFANVCCGGVISKITANDALESYALIVTWHTGKSQGRGAALFEGDGSALLAVELLKNVTFGASNKLRITDPVKHAKKEGIYKIALSNLPLDFDDESLTRSLAKLNLENFTEAYVLRKDPDFYHDNDIAVVKLKSLFTDYNLIDMKLHPSRNGTSKAILNFLKMRDCLDAISKLNGKTIDFGIPNDRLKVSLDLRVVLEVPQFVYNVIRPEVEKLMYLIRKSPSMFFGVKVFLFGNARSASTDHARIVICGNDPKAICLARKVYDNLTKPLIMKFEDQAKCRLVYKKLMQNEPLKAFKCCLVNCKSDVNTIYVYGIQENRVLMKAAMDEIDKCVVYDSVNVEANMIRSLLNNKENVDKLKEFEAKFSVFVNANVAKKVVQIVRFKDVSSNDNDSKNDDGDSGKDCLKFIEELTTQSKRRNVLGNDEVMGGDEVETIGDDEVISCGVCFMAIEADEEYVTLRCCNHSFHSDCFELQLKSSCQPGGNRPLKCAICSVAISLVDLQEFSENEEKYKQLLRYCVSDYVDGKPNEYKHCPTPDCKQVYVEKFVNEGKEGGGDDDSDKKNDGDVDALFSCSECMRQYCLQCDVEYHYGLSCEAFEKSKTADKSFEKFILEYKSNSETQKCPNCNTITDKFKNTCNHATCVYCGAHFCWKCLWMSSDDIKNGGLVYKHMQKDHGSYYG